MTPQNYIANSLENAASKHLLNYPNDYDNHAHCLRDLTKLYHRIALHSSTILEDQLGCTQSFTATDLDDTLNFAYYKEANSDIFATELSNIVTPYIDKAKCQHRPSYKNCVQTLIDAGIIHCNKSYRHDAHNGFPRQYGLHANFIRNAFSYYTQTNSEINFFKALRLLEPPRTLKHKIRKVKDLYEETRNINGLQIVLPSGWESAVDEYGDLTVNPKLNIDLLYRNMQIFSRQYDAGYKFGRYYDWFTFCSPEFRSLIHINGKHFVELADCPSGMYAMLPIVGVQERQISPDECHAIIDHCFQGTFYSDLSGEKKTKRLKVQFMIVFNSSPSAFSIALKDPVISHIATSTQALYPGFWTWIEERRHRFGNKLGRQNHIDSTCIEKKLMETAKKRLEGIGLSNIRRVHDALYGIEYIPGVQHMLYTIAIELLNEVNS